ncbi:hypothetical protein JKF63_04348 [Porcisia hertigi]|uniref:Uncharacterized protein n=1 Tax=Porcisia hertigi TaxID=2761500 RepID=A0A836IGE0_9TRYP|nr:hypothetical protein JKF63_04348 [Porcisia hertigi]
MTDSTYSYSYTGSYTGDYSYSYGYSDDTITGRDGNIEKSPPHVPAVASGDGGTRGRNRTPPPKPKAADSVDSYTYSYSYSDSDSSSAVLVPAAGNTGSQKRQKTSNWDEDSAQSNSYTSESDDGSYSYSYSDSQIETNSPSGQRAAGTTIATPRQPPGGRTVGPHHQTPATIASDTDTGSHTYSYSYSNDEGSYSYTYSDGSYYYSDGSYYYTDTPHDTDGSYYYSYSSSASTEQQKQLQEKPAAATTSDYSEGYSDSYYYYDYSTRYSGDKSDYTDYYSYYSYSSYSGSSYTGKESYDDYSYSYSSFTDSKGRHHRATNGARRRHPRKVADSSYSTYSVTSKPPSSTTSSYEYGITTQSLLSESETATQRALVILRAPAKDAPRPPPAPKRCFVLLKSTEDAVWTFLERLMAAQRFYEGRRSAACIRAGEAAAYTEHTETPPDAVTIPGGKRAAASKAKTKKDGKSKRSTAVKSEATEGQEGGPEEAEEEDTGKPFIPTKDGCFSERSIRIAFGVLRLNHLERHEALKNAPAPLPMGAMFDIFNACVTARGKGWVTQAFLAHDTYRSGEISLTQMGALLQRLGLGTSPIIEGYRISTAVSTEGIHEMVVNVEQLVQPATPPVEAGRNEVAEDAAAAAAATATSTASSLETSSQPMQWRVTPIRVLQIIRKNAAKNEPTPVRWEKNTVFMGRHAILRGVTSKALFQRLKTYIEAATYLCVLANVFSIEDPERGTLTVQYPQFIRSVLLANPPPHSKMDTAAWAAQRKLLYIDNLFHTVFRPLEALQTYEAGRPVPRYHKDWALESTLHSTNDTEEKRRRNVVPATSVDGLHLIPAPTARPPGEVQLSFALQKVRVPARPPSNARCFCLVSAVTPDNVFLPAITVPVYHIVASTKKSGDYTWVFHDKKHKKQDTVLQFAGSAVDRIYVECCYETNDARSPASSDDVAGEEKGGAGLLAPPITRTVWCAGYAVFTVGGAKTALHPIKEGSLLQEQPIDSTHVSSGISAGTPAPVTATATPEGKHAKPKKGLLRWISNVGLCGQHTKRNAAEKAHHVKVEVLNSKKHTPGAERLPARYIAYQRHVSMISHLRAAVHLVGQETAYALQAFRQQAVRYIFSVAADAALLDQLSVLWAYREKHWSKTERKDEVHKQRALLACVAALYALNNTCAVSKESFAKCLKKGNTHHMTIDPAAPMVPVRV